MYNLLFLSSYRVPIVLSDPAWLTREWIIYDRRRIFSITTKQRLMSKIGEFYHISNFHLIHFFIFTCCTSLNDLDYIQKLKLKFILQIFHCIQRKGGIFLVSDHGHLKSFCIHEDSQYSIFFWQGCHNMHSCRKWQQDKRKFSIRADRSIETEWCQYKRKKTRTE